MPNDFIVRPKCTDKKEDKSITMTIRLERELQEQYDDLSAKSGRSRNELMCMALRYALDNLKFTSKLDIENPIIRINTAFKGCSSLEKISVLPRIYHN